MHQRQRLSIRSPRRFVAAVLTATVLAGTAVVVRAADGPYNSNPPYCRSHGPGDLLWWWNECMYPDPPDWGIER